MPQASVIVPVRNAQATLARTLAALAAQDCELEYEVIVVDDGSADRSLEIARAARGPNLVLTGLARGPAAARDLGVRHARGEWLAFCDADVFPTPGWLTAGIAALQQADLVQGQVLPDPRARLGPFDRTIWITGAVGLWETANLFVTHELFERAGGFAQAITPRRGKQLGEDVLFGYRARRLGARTAFAPGALAHHAVFPRGWRACAGERRRLVHFPAIARSAPEFRVGFLYRRMFLNRRSARLDLALLGGALAISTHSRLPLLTTLPYLRELRTRAARASPPGPSPAAVAAADLAADLVGLAALLAGSVRYRTPVL